MPSSLLDLPEEILQSILAYAMCREVPMHLEYCTERCHPSNETSREPPQGMEGAMPPRTVFAMEYKFAHLRSSLRSDLDPYQTEHVADWIRINSTCRVFRRLGKPLFFSQKTMALTYSVQYLMRLGEFSAFTVEDQRLALERIQFAMLIEAGFLEDNAWDPGWGRLDIFMCELKHLRRLDIMLGYREGMHVDQVRVAFTQGKTHQLDPEITDELPTQVKHMDRIRLKSVYIPDTDWEKPSSSRDHIIPQCMGGWLFNRYKGSWKDGKPLYDHHEDSETDPEEEAETSSNEDADTGSDEEDDWWRARFPALYQ